ncbi:hypothetical protein QO002_004556 [Pararhizobium capsulatum DSM 1112]|uniref:Transposase n=1 Tax=Pararhizobium capsulatum DSM 1112 TaxID=1121113 RepID=A0ABU0BVR4_9HYPH|nr:hypothetical protein [Pararhizobium capsulatum]MDQ0322350.1 hypothetical protein [Pararhizobium capsulatum DSM 1112]
MLTPLTILSLDQGKIYLPPPDRFGDGMVETSMPLVRARNPGRKLAPWEKAKNVVRLLNQLYASTAGRGRRAMTSGLLAMRHLKGQERQG